MAEIRNCTTNFYPELCGVNVIVDPQVQVETERDAILIPAQTYGGTSGAGEVHRALDSSRGALFGVGSMANLMVDQVKALAPTAPIYVYTVANTTGTAGDADVTVTGVDTASSSGVRYLFVNGRPYSTYFNPADDTNSTVAARLAAVIAASEIGMSVTAAANVINITTNSVGRVGGFLDVRGTYSRRPDLVSHDDVSLAITITPGAGDPDLSALAGVDHGCSFIADPYATDTISSALCASWSGSYAPNSRAYGVHYATFLTAAARYEAMNNALHSYLTVYGALSEPYLATADYAALAYNRMNTLSDNIAGNMTGLQLPSLVAPEAVDVFSQEEKAYLFNAGGGYFDITRNGNAVIGRATTTYRTRDNGAADNTYLDVNAVSIDAYLKASIQQGLYEKYVANGYSIRTDNAAGRIGKVVTLNGVRNYILTLAQEWSNLNIVQGVDDVAANLSVTANTDGCVVIDMPYTRVNPFCCVVATIRPY